MKKIYYTIVAGLIFANSAMAELGGLKSTGDAMGFKGAQLEGDISSRLGLYMNVAISFLGVIFLGLTIYGGYLWMTAQGDGKKVDEAKDIIKRAVIGIVIVASAYAITAFVGGFADGVNNTDPINSSDTAQ